jgi:hypothetical protein
VVGLVVALLVVAGLVALSACGGTDGGTDGDNSAADDPIAGYSSIENGAAPVVAEVSFGRPASLVTTDPVTVVDTRNGRGAVVPDEAFEVTLPAVVPRSATAVLATITMIDTTASGWLEARPIATNGSATTTSTVAVEGSEPIRTVLPTSPEGLHLSSSISGQLVIEITGWVTGTPTLPPAPDPSFMSGNPGDEPSHPDMNDAGGGTPPSTDPSFMSGNPGDEPSHPDMNDGGGGMVERRVLVISDSSGAGMRWTPGASRPLQGAEFTLDLESCRRLITPSCRGRDGYRPSNALEALRAQAGAGHDTLIMFTGYNDLDQDFEAAFDKIMTIADEQGFTSVIWATYREQVGYMMPTGAATSYAAMNETLWQRAASGDHPQLHIMDWWGYTFQAPHWLAPDGVHFSDVGSFGLADLISRTLAALDGRPCPMPWAPGEAPEDPCPLPYVLPQERGGVPPVLELYDAG